MRSQSSQFHWDKRSKKYVKLQPSESVKAGRRLNKGGSSKKGAEEPSGLYKKWSSRNKMVIAPGKEGEGAEALSRQLRQRFKRGGRGWVNPLKAGADGDAAAAPDEIKRPEQVRRTRKLEERRKEKLQKQREGNDRRGGKMRGGGGGKMRGGGVGKTRGGGVGKTRAGPPRTGKPPSHKGRAPAGRKPAGGRRGR